MRYSSLHQFWFCPALICRSRPTINDAFFPKDAKPGLVTGLRFLRMSKLLAGLCLCVSRAVGAHTLPISYLLVVPGAEYLHLEFVLNPFELNGWSLLDKNEVDRVEHDEIAPAQEKLARQVLEAITVRIDGKPVAAEVAGIEPEPNSHHLTLRGQYRVDARRAKVGIESRLSSTLGMSHLTQVTLLRDGRQQLAQLTASGASAEFAGRPSAGAARPGGTTRWSGGCRCWGWRCWCGRCWRGLLALFIHQEARRAAESRKLKPLEAL